MTEKEMEEGWKPTEADWHWGRIDGGKWVPIAVEQWFRDLTADKETFVQFPGWSVSHPLADLQGVEIGPRLTPPRSDEG